jgi:Capsule polysaccharide biosynthesis protein
MRIARKVRTIKRAVRRIYPVKVPQPDWKELLGQDYAAWKSLAASPAQGKQRILLAPSMGGPGISTLDSLLAVALTLRGAEVHVLLCDEVLPACQACLLERLPDEREFLRHGPKRDLCPTCFSSGFEMFEALGIRVHRYGQFLSSDDIKSAKNIANELPLDEIDAYKLFDLPVGEHALAGAIRFFARGALEREPHGEEVLRQYLSAAVLTTNVIRRLFKEFKYDCTSFHHGIYVPQGLIGAVARAEGVRVVNWAIAYRKRTFIFTHGDTYHHTLMSEPVSNWTDLDWNPGIETDLLEYLRSREKGGNDWISFNRDSRSDSEQIGRETGIDFTKTSVGLLTNVVWDAQLHYPQNAFPNMMDWLLTTIRYFMDRPELQLIIRVHPAELNGQIKSRQPVVEEIKREFPTLPTNIFIIPPESSISTYAVMAQCDSVLIYGTKTGVELTSLGIPVIVAGEAWIRNKGITSDALSVDHYLSLLDSLPQRQLLSEETIRRARKYAYHFFFRRMIPLRVISSESLQGWAPYTIQIKGLDDLLPGKDPGLDVICGGILHGSEFIYPAEQIQEAYEQQIA